MNEKLDILVKENEKLQKQANTLQGKIKGIEKDVFK